MRPPTDTSTFELLPFVHTLEYDAPGRESSQEQILQTDLGHDTNKRSATVKLSRKALFYLPLVAALVPIILLLASSSRLSQALGSNGCLPSGDFVLPYTSSVWDSSQFFAITIGFTGPRASPFCSAGGTLQQGLSAVSSYQACPGYGFKTVKVIDVAFDLLVGRAGQLILAALAYRLFSRILTSMMQQGQVGYDMFGAVAFQSCSLISVPTLLRHALGSTPIPRTRRSRVIFLCMGLVTVYIVAVPTLVSAMSGYTSHFTPYVFNTTAQYDENRFQATNQTQAVVDCLGRLEPAWGILMNSPVLRLPSLDSDNSAGAHSLSEGTLIDFDVSQGWADYVERYLSIYDACNGQNFSSCAAAKAETFVLDSGTNWTVGPPAAQIQTWSSPNNQYSHWDCGGALLRNEWMSIDGYIGDDGLRIQSTGFCMSGQNYAWGFSFVLTFIVSILHLVFTLLMYAIWYSVRSQPGEKPEQPHSAFYDAIFMVTNARAQHGDQISDWSARTLERDILRGKKGLSLQGMSIVRKRRSHTDLGDPRAGDWGGDVTD